MRKFKIFFFLSLFIAYPVWLYLKNPIYDEAKVEALISRNIPVGTDMREVMLYLDTLKWKDVVTEGDMAYFPTTLYMRGWWYLRVDFEVKNGKMVGYEMDRIKI